MAISDAESQVTHVLTGLTSSCPVSASGRSCELAEKAADSTFTIFVGIVGHNSKCFKHDETYSSL